MMKNISLFLVLAITIISCKSTSETSTDTPVGDTSQTSLDWNGIYVGTTPCADCPGIKTVIILNNDLTYTKQTKYLERPVDATSETGTFSWNAAGNTVTLKANGNTQAYFVGEGTLTHLDLNGKKITGDLADKYVLKQQPENMLIDTPWKLVELNGKPIANVSKQPFLLLSGTDNRVSGNTSCNGFGGEYELLEGNRIKFSKMMHTMMACPDMTVENQFMKVLEMADNYSVVNGVLNINKGRMATLAKFKVDYLLSN
ncbi:copper resistance protein NlpE N-terminal domain-containing protein [Formosa sp. A9]|uniref:copper resistance protein NlpE N-terminal domain-containing protein n=1 Tax=Formosa sp. A9 TaxID=3442641 RepID=UPI003EBF5674